MSSSSPTLDSLVALGFERWQGQRRPLRYGQGAADALFAIHGLREPAPGADAVVYAFADFDLFCTQTMSRYMREMVRVHGVIYTGRTLVEIDSEIPENLEDPLEAAAWVSYVLKSDRSYLTPLPDWLVEGERHWHLIPFLRESQERKKVYDASPKCFIDRDYARPLRRNLVNEISSLDGDADEMTFSFDGRVLSIEVSGHLYEVLASGEGWQSSYNVAVSRGSKLPARFMYWQVEVLVMGGYLLFDKLSLGPCVTVE